MSASGSRGRSSDSVTPPTWTTSSRRSSGRPPLIEIDEVGTKDTFRRALCAGDACSGWWVADPHPGWGCARRVRGFRASEAACACPGEASEDVLEADGYPRREVAQPRQGEQDAGHVRLARGRVVADRERLARAAE